MDGSRQQSADAADSERRAAASRVLAGDGRTFVLQPWQVAYLVDVSEGREGFVPPACGVGKGWLDARLREALEGEGSPTEERATEPG
jgi:hypothetical protein